MTPVVLPGRFGPELDAAEQAGMVQALQRTLHASLIETHISWVLVAGARAYKIKKALRTAFLDQTTRELRLRACEEELRLNRRLAPTLYEDVLTVTGSAAAPELGGTGPALDHVVAMRSFDQGELWERRAERGQLKAEHIDRLLEQLVPFHERSAEVDLDSPFGTAAALRRTVLQNLAELEPCVPAGLATPQEMGRLREWEAAAFAFAQPRIEKRRARGRVRECHGDLHLGNVTEFEGRTTAFDGIEFSAALRWTDVMADLAFMAMDLQAHGLAPLAHRLVNGYLEATGDHDGLPVLDYQLVHRALVRAKVSFLRSAQPGQLEAGRREARRYLQLALQLTARPPAQLLVTHGCSGSGKSTATQRLLEELGAIRVRSDVERRRLDEAAGVPRYGVAMDKATYAQLAALARRMLQDGHPVIVDATFLRHADRLAMRQLSEALGVPFGILDFVSGADEALMRQRVRERALRGGDASEADESVLAGQLLRVEPLRPEELAVAIPGWPQD